MIQAMIQLECELQNVKEQRIIHTNKFVLQPKFSDLEADKSKYFENKLNELTNYMLEYMIRIVINGRILKNISTNNCRKYGLQNKQT